MCALDFKISQTKRTQKTLTRKEEKNKQKNKIDDAFANKIRSIEMPEMALI